jgi:hypothetical protein
MKALHPERKVNRAIHNFGLVIRKVQETIDARINEQIINLHNLKQAIDQGKTRIAELHLRLETMQNLDGLKRQIQNLPTIPVLQRLLESFGQLGNEYHELAQGFYPPGYQAMVMKDYLQNITDAITIIPKLTRRQQPTRRPSIKGDNGHMKWSWRIMQSGSLL